MPATKSHSVSLRELETALIWGAWVELGVSGWERTHRDWVVDPEPLIVRTAELADTDARLRDEALDWCIHYRRYVSRVRLRTLLRGRSDEAQSAWGRFAATVNAHSTARWPGATEPMSYKLTGRSSLTSMKEPSRAWLRMRATFGVGARTEILRYFLSGHARSSTATMVDRLGYTKSNVINECDSLEKAGVLRRGRIGNRYFYSLTRSDALLDFIGEIGPIRPSWSALLAVTSAVVTLEEAAEILPQRVLTVEAHQTSRQLDQWLDQLEIEERPELSRPDGYWTDIRTFAHSYLSAWAAGRWDPTQRPPRKLGRNVQS
jgi:hypothetical protein